MPVYLLGPSEIALICRLPVLLLLEFGLVHSHVGI